MTRRRRLATRIPVGVLGTLLVAVGLPLTLNQETASAASPCGPPVTSVIACENLITGDPPATWQVAGAGDATLQGFATAMSVSAGQMVTFKVQSTASAYHFDILRLGYYQGNGARKVANGLTPSASYPQTQPACRTDATTGLIDCGNWGVSASWTVPSNAVSGVYIAHLIRNDNGGGSDIPFVVRNDSSHSDMVVQTSDETWEAYNSYGGNSLYQCTVACPPGNPAAYKAAYKVSYNRPFHTGGDDVGQSWLWYSELPMIQFLEQNGYDLTYVAGTDVDSGGANLTNHKVFMSSGHDEYWSGNQRANVEAALSAGVNLTFFSGNEVFWKTRFEASTDGSNTPQRTLVSYKETHFSAPVDPKDPPTWTGTWEDPRFSPPADGGKPSNALTGQKFIVNSGTTDIKVPSTYSQLRLWRNTAVASLGAGQSVTLGAGLGTLGYEWDEDTDNGFRPAGLFDLSSTTSSTAEVFTDYGSSTKLNSTATHHLTLYRAPSGALVFGSGTVQWSWGLNNSWTGGATDRNMQQATVNLFADMGVQPATLMSGLTAATRSTDTTPPTSHVTSPAPGANLTDGAVVTISGTASDAGGGVVAGVEVSTDGGTTWHPANGTTSWSYSWIAHGNPSTAIRTRAVDDSGNLESASAGVAVNVACPCSIWGPNLTPQTPDGGDANKIEIGVKFTSDAYGTINGIRFYKASANTGTHIGNLWTATGQLLASATFSGETASGWQQVTFSSPVPIYPNTTYIASYFAPNSHYANDDNYFAGAPQPPNKGLSMLNSAPLHAQRQTTTSSNGVYVYSSTSTFPTNRDNFTNYWVDVSFTPQPAPGAASNVVAAAGYASAALSWTAPATGGPVTTYTVTPYIGPAAQTPVTVSGTPAPTGATVAGLTNGTTYTFTVTASNPAGAGPASAPSNAVTPSATASAVINGGFENGLAAWTLGGIAAPSVSTTRAHSGSSSALLGVVQPAAEPNGDSTLSQTISVPTGTSQLSFWYWTQSSDTLCSGSACTFDWQEAQIRDTSGHTLAQIFKSNTNAQAWTSVTFDTTPYAGQTVVLWFNDHEDGASSPDDSWMYLDDVNLITTGAPTAPGAPTGVAATAGSSSATVSWTPPANGGSPITAYTVTPFIGTAAQSPVQVTGSPPVTSTVVAGLTPGTAYTFKVSATNAVGTGPSSAASNAVTPTAPTAPAAPTGVSAVPADSSATVTWTAPANGGNAITAYTVTPFIGTAAQTPTTVTGSPPATSAVVVGLTDGTAYTFKVSATNGVGTGPLSAASSPVTPVGPPAAPAAPAAAAGNGSATVTWTAPANGGSPITSYTVTPFIGTAAQSSITVTGSPPPTSANVSGLTNGTAYTFTVAAANAAGIGPASAPSNAVTPVAPSTPPSAPSGVTATAGVGSATVSWTAPFSGSSPITSYTVTPFIGTTAQSPTTVTGSPPATSATVSGLTNGTTYTFKVSATNSVGPGAASAASNLATPQASAPACTCTIFGSSTPSVVDSGDPASVVLGVAFTSDTNGYITGIRFYKAAANTGTHVGTLWSSTGTALGTATFTNETASGWQQVSFATPVAITAGTTYVASYLAPAGHYSNNSGAFTTSPVMTPPLYALANSTTPNGVYAYSSSNVFPQSSYNATNYWVDVLFTTNAPGAPTGVTATAGNASATVSWTAPLSASGPITSYTITPFAGSTAQSPTAVTGSPPATSATVSGLTNGTTYTFRVSATNASGTGAASAASNPATPQAVPPACPCTIFGSSTPSVVDSGDGASVVLGVAFDSDTSGYIAGIRFYKAAANTGTHVGTLWSSSGTALASATFTNETASGWQQVTFATPVAVTAGTTYVASYLAPAGHYAATASAFASSGAATPPLYALASTTTPNGVYAYSASNVFPTSSFSATNYWVDVVFSTTPPSLPGAPTGVTATVGNASATVSWTAPASGSSPITSYTITPLIGSTAQAPTTVTGSPPATSATVGGLTNGTTYTFTVSASSAAGTGPASAASNAVTPQPAGCPCSIFGNAIPSVVDSGDGASVVLGVVFKSDTNGYVTGIRFYKSSANTGTHVGTLWSSTGTALASATFTNETTSGWQQVSFATPVAVTAGTTYVASYLAPAGHYADNSGAFASSGVDTPPLHALANTTTPNGVFVYSSSNAFPTFSFNATNYWVDVVLTAAPSAPTGVTATAANASATVTWTAPADWGSPITGYTITPFIGPTAQTPTTVTGSPPATSVVVNGLTNGTAYTFRVSATNAVGTGAASAASGAVTPIGPPGAPTNVTATRGVNSATVTWTAPPNGGSTITSYTITPFIGSTAQTPTTVTGSPPPTSATVSGLNGGTTYTFTVSATNAAGTGPASAPSNAVTACTLVCL